MFNTDVLFVWGTYVIKNVQLKLGAYDSIIPLVSQVFDPKYAYYVYFPILYAINDDWGLRMVFTTALSEYLNMMLKWIFQEPRPYWWVHEYSHKINNLTLTQYEMTCETGPGSPSGHVMISAAVWYIIVATIVKRLHLAYRVLLWICYCGLIFAIAISRMFVAAHFPHQCVLGFFLGVALGETAMRRKLNSFGSPKIFLISVILLASTLALYNYLNFLGLDPNRSINMALKWCSIPENVHTDTTPLYCSTRYSGVVLGMAIGNYNSDWQRKLKLKPKYVKIFIAVLGLVFAYFLIFDLSKNDFIYPLSYLSHALTIFAIVRIAPEIVVWLATDDKTIKDQKLN